MANRRFLPIILAALGGAAGLYVTLLIIGHMPGSTRAVSYGDAGVSPVLEQRLSLLETRIEDIAEKLGQEQPAHLSPDRETSEFDHLQHQLDTLSGVVDDVAWRVANEKSTPSGNIETGDQSIDRVYEKEESKRVREELFSALAKRLEEEPPDPEWSGDTETEIETTFTSDSVLANTHLLNAKCGTTLCRIEVAVAAHTDTSDMDDLGDELQMQWAYRFSSGSMQTVTDPDGETRVIVYYARKGHSLYQNQQ